MSTKSKKTSLAIFIALSLFVIVVSCSQNLKEQTDNAKIGFSPEIPVDVNPTLQDELKKNGNIFALNQAFNEYSWQAFVAIQWPRDEKGNPKPNFYDQGTPTWLGWKEAFQVYRKDGKKPAPWGSPRNDSGLGLPSNAVNNDDARVYLSSNTPTHPGSMNIADEVDQAFAGKLFDQNGNVVVYEVLMNKAEYDYVVDNQLYNLEGQLAFSKINSAANFPAGNYNDNTVGATEIKFAWKILEENDYKDRYFRDEGYIVNEKTGELELKDLGLIGMHISQKTPTGKQWVWSTFEHIDNLDQNVIVENGKENPIHPSLTDPECEICPVNVDVTNGGSEYTYHTSQHSDYWTVSGDSVVHCPGEKGALNKYFANGDVMKTQSKRMVDIPIRVQNINKKMQSFFKSKNSIWQYYQLIDTQYPIDQNDAAAPNEEATYKLPESVINKPGGNPNIALLTNISMETFFQLGNQSASNLMEDNPSSPYIIYGTESCMGCHSSASIPRSFNPKDSTFLSGGQLSGDFSWLLGKANWNNPPSVIK